MRIHVDSTPAPGSGARGTLDGIGKPGQIVWGRVFVEGGMLHVDIGRASAPRLRDEETERRRRATTEPSLIVRTILHGVGRDPVMARHQDPPAAPAAPDASKAHGGPWPSTPVASRPPYVPR